MKGNQHVSLNDNTVNLIRDSIRDGFSQVNDRLDKHYDLFGEHVKDDKEAWKKLDDVTVEIKVGKRVFYALSSALSVAMGYLHLNR